MISIRQIQVFNAIVHTESIADASEQLFLTKPAVSMALKELESQLGVELFDRIKNRLHINHYGQTFLIKADELYARAQEAAQLFLYHNSEAGLSTSACLKIGASNTIGTYLLPDYIKQYRDKTNNTNQTITISNSDDIAESVAHFQLDIGLVEGLVVHSQLQSQPWINDQMSIIINNNHPLTQCQPSKLEDLSDEHWILREKGSGSRNQFLYTIANRLSHWHMSIELPNSESMIRAVMADLGLAFMSRSAAEIAINKSLVTELKLINPPELTRQLWIITHKERYLSPLVKQFISLLLQ